VVTPTNASGGPVEETAVLPRVRMDKDQRIRMDKDPEPDGSAGRADGRASGKGTGAGSDAEVTTELPQPSVPPAGAADETAVLPPVPPAGAADETAVLPPVRGESPADRVPPGYFRDERAGAGPDGSEDRTRELPQVDEEGTPRQRPRSDWAEETPLDDLPTLADELLGPHRDDDFDEGPGGRRGRGRRR
jgi:dTMP kinase